MQKIPFSLDLANELLSLEKNQKLTLVNVGNLAAKSFLISKILEKTNFENIFWAASDEKSDQIVSTAVNFFDTKILQIPEDFSIREFYKINEAVKRKEKHIFVFENFEKIYDQKFPSIKQIKAEKVEILKNQKAKIYDIFEKLTKIGYSSAEDKIIKPGEFVRLGEMLFVYPINSERCFRCELYDDKIEKISTFQFVGESQTDFKTEKKCEIFPIKFPEECTSDFWESISIEKKSILIRDDNEQEMCSVRDLYEIKFTTFPDDREKFFHLNFFSVLPFYTVPDFVIDIKERFRREFKIVLMTKRFEEVEKIFRDTEIMFTEDLKDETPSTVKIIKLKNEGLVPNSFQNNTRKILFLTDREIFQFHRTNRQKKAISGMNMGLMTGLKVGDFVVHIDNGISKFDGVVRRKFSQNGDVEMSREYLKLCYAENDKLFVPVESAEKITKFIGDDVPKLSRLGSTEWQNSQKKLKKETEKIAKELLKLYAQRELTPGKKYPPDDEMMKDFCESFPYEPTPGQAMAWNDVRMDLESKKAMDRLVCGDVGFGKTEIAMRAAFKSFRAGKQTAFLAPITILAEQHYRSFEKRIKGKNYGVRVALLSRFQTPKEQKKILQDAKLGLVDIVIGTHRLLSDDVKFKNLGLLIIDEEQRFGVAQKEKLKKLRVSVDLLTMTATPIPRTLNMSLNKLKDISTITTAPPGRLPIITEVRKYNLNLIRERILFEKNRGGQVYFLHNEVRTIEAIATQLRALIPECKFIIGHGQMKPDDLAQQIKKFKNGKADVLIASTIIENGIDFSNANTLLVNRAEKFGLSQLYQLRGRVGRSRTQAHAYFLYHGQKLELEAKKRLRAIVEANELGAGFQIAMRDLEIRGAGEILGASQAGTLKTMGVAHFMRMLQKTVEEMKSGEVSSEIEEDKNISVEIPLSAYIPSNFIPNTNEKIQAYKDLASSENVESLFELKKDLEDDYGRMPLEVENLVKIIQLKIFCRKANLSGVKIHRPTHRNYEVVLRMGANFSPDQIFNLVKKSSNKWIITASVLKISCDKLPITWYSKILEEVKLLVPVKSNKQ